MNHKIFMQRIPTNGQFKSRWWENAGVCLKKMFVKYQLLATIVSWTIKKTLWNKNGGQVRNQLTEENWVFKQILWQRLIQTLVVDISKGQVWFKNTGQWNSNGTGSRPLSQYFIIILSPYALSLPFAHHPSAVPCSVLSLDWKLIRIHVLHSCVNCRAYNCSFRQK